MKKLINKIPKSIHNCCNSINKASGTRQMCFCANFKTIYTQIKQTDLLLLSHLGDKLLLKLTHTVNQDRGRLP
jgi:hypothetical protein